MWYYNKTRDGRIYVLYAISKLRIIYMNGDGRDQVQQSRYKLLMNLYSDSKFIYPNSTCISPITAILHYIYIYINYNTRVYIIYTHYYQNIHLR